MATITKMLSTANCTPTPTDTWGDIYCVEHVDSIAYIVKNTHGSNSLDVRLRYRCVAAGTWIVDQSQTLAPGEVASVKENYPHYETAVQVKNTTASNTAAVLFECSYTIIP